MGTKNNPPYKKTIPAEERRQYILELLEEEEVLSQEYLVKKLTKKFGQSISPATVSRDLTALAIVKTSNGYRQATEAASTRRQDRLVGTLQEFDVTVHSDGVVLAISTSAGSARTVAVKIAKAFPDEVAGSVASDDLALIVAYNQAARKTLATVLSDLALLNSKGK